MGSNILIYYPSNKQSNVIETIAGGFVDKGHKVFLLTHSQHGALKETLEKRGVICHEHVCKKGISIFYYLNHFFFLMSFCRKNKIQAIQSHLQQTNIIAVFAQFFIKARVVLYRHHLIEPNRTSVIFDKIINNLGRCIVVPSLIIKEKMLVEEDVNEKKIKLIPYVYDFEKYPKPDKDSVSKIRSTHACKLLLLLCGRFVQLKRNEIAFMLLKQLRDENLDIKLMALDEGPELSKIKAYVHENKLDSFVDFLGYRDNVIDYIDACDVMINPSFTEASNNAIKEAGLQKKNVVVCEHVGDFSEYIIDGKNGYLASKDKPLDDFVRIIKDIYENNNRAIIGNELHKTIIERFQCSDEKIDMHLKLLID